MGKKYWHKLTHEEQQEVKQPGKTIGWLLKNYKQPDWCSHYEALAGDMGCWSLFDINDDGTGVTRKSCKSNCEFYTEDEDPNFCPICGRERKSNYCSYCKEVTT